MVHDQFGGAYGRPTRDSDVDLLVIMPYRGRPLRLIVKILMKSDPPFPVDLIVYRPEEVRRRYREFDPLVREAIDRGKVLYERYGERMARQGGGRFCGRGDPTKGLPNVLRRGSRVDGAQPQGAPAVERGGCHRGKSFGQQPSNHRFIDPIRLLRRAVR